MEIKKGISQMAEYPNVEINYVVPKNGNMYYVLKGGELENGVIIATLDPRHAIDEENECSTVGAFSERGDVIIDFDKKSVKKITEDLLLAVNSKPITTEVMDNLSKKDDEISKTAIEDNKKVIEEQLMSEMGVQGELIFSDPYGEANVYSTDSYNNKLGLDCSFIGKNEKGLYFHTTDINSASKFIKVDGFQGEVDNSTVEEVLEDKKVETIQEESSDVEEVADISDANSLENEELKLDISQNVLDGFKITDEELNQITPEEIENEMNEEVEEKVVEDTVAEDRNDNHDDEIFDNAMSVISKLMEETNKLNEKIKKLEEEIQEKNKIIEEQEEKKDELNNLLGKANEVLDNIK